jgi:preprotein translocase subunit SecE
LSVQLHIRSVTKRASMSILISVLITFLVVALILWLVQRLPIEGRLKQILQVVVIVIGIIALLRYLAVF